MNKKIKVLFVYWSPSTFIQRDLNILRKHFEVRVLGRANIKSPIFWLKAFTGSLWADVTFSWFASPPALVIVLLSKIFRTKSIVVVGGYEVANEPEIGYGGMLNPVTRTMVKFTLKHADKILAVSEFSKKEILRCSSPKDIKLVYHGVDCSKFKPNNKKGDLVITVGTISNDVVKLKGIEFFVRAAKYLPKVRFIVVGEIKDRSIQHLKSVSPSNVQFTGFIPNSKLITLYRRAKVYCQLSLRESFGVALAEAMACRCVPVVTDRGAIPEVVGDIGFYVPYGDPGTTARVIKKALRSMKGKKARARIKKNFTFKKRERELTGVVRRLTD